MYTAEVIVSDPGEKSSPVAARRRTSSVARQSIGEPGAPWSGSQTNITALRGSEEAEGSGGDVIHAPIGRVTLPLAITALVTIMGSSFPHGWGTGVLNSPALLIQNFLNESYAGRTGSYPEPWFIDLLWAGSVSIYLLGGCGGAFCVGFLADKFGRKKALLLCNVFQFIAAALFVFCQLANSFEMLLLARLFTGFGCGAGSGLVPMYLTEISPVNIRGAMGVLHQFACTFGILMAQVAGLQGCLGRPSLWPILLALYIVPCTVSLLVLPWFPESPRYLLVNRGLEDEAVKALQRFRGEEDVSEYVEEMRAEQEVQRSTPKWTFSMLFRARDLRLPLVLLCSLAMSQQLSGINVVFYYSTGIFLEAKIPVDMVQYANIGTGVINLLMTGISVPLMEKSGRRPLLLGGMGVMVMSTVGLTIAITLQARAAFLSYVSIVCVITYVIGFALGLGSIPQFIGAELFKQGPRPPAMSFAGLLNWLCNFIVGITFPSMQSAIEAYSFLVFTTTLVGFGIFFYFKLPETKNKTFDQIYRLMGISTTADQEKGQVTLPLLTNGDEKQSSVKFSTLASNDEIQPINGNTKQLTKSDSEQPFITDVKDSVIKNGKEA